MATAKLRTLDTAKGLTPYELELINKNFFDMEAALNSIGATTPGSTGSPPSSVPVDHGALLGLGDDDHIQYLLLAGRSDQILRWIDFNFPALTIQPSSSETVDKTLVRILGFGGTGLEIFGVRSGNNPNVRVNGIFDIASSGGTLSIRPTASLINIAILGVSGGVAFDSKVQAETNAHSRINNVNTSTPVANTNLGVSVGDYLVMVTLSVRTIQAGITATLTLNWNDGISAKSTKLVTSMAAQVELNRVYQIRLGSGLLTYSLDFPGISVGRVDAIIKVQRFTQT